MKIIYLILFILAGFSGMAQQQPITPAVVQKPVYFDVSPPLRDMVNQSQFPADRSWKDGIVKNVFGIKSDSRELLPNYNDPLIQRYNGQTQADTTIQNFEGLGGGTYIPPDTDGDIGPNHYFQVVNASYAIYNKVGLKLLGPSPSSSVWNGMPNNSNDGDAVVLYDEIANRWIFTQFSLPNYPNGPFYQMIAVSQTPDPTGSWYRYEYSFTAMPDYPKFGIWPDGYYMSCNQFSAGAGNFAGVGAAAFDRSQMLTGNPGAQMIWFTLPSSNEAFGMMPSDCDGAFPPAGTPNYFTYRSGAGSSHLGILEFHADWTNTANSTFGNLLSLPVNTFSSSLGLGIPQLGTAVRLATLSDRLMYRLQFRKFNDHWSMVVNHTVNAGSGIAGIRWYELRKTSGAWEVYQQATYAPSDNLYRWMGSMAMDTAGNIALGYSVSGTTIYPSIRYTGRLSTDPLNQMTITERRIKDGGGCQTSTSQRWGDYSSLRIDPSAPTTFWYTTEYYSTTSSSSWQTRIASFTFENVFSSYASVSPVKVCSGDSAQLTSVTYGGSGNYTYSWTSLPAGFISTLRNPKVAPSDTTKYIVVVSDGIQTHHDTTQLAIIAHPVSFAGNDTTVCSTMTSIDLHGTASGYNAVAWATSGNGHFSSTSTLNTTYTFGPGDYSSGSVNLKLVAVPINPCSGNAVSTKHVILDPCNAINEAKTSDPFIVIQPNPARESIRVIISGLQNKTAVLTLMTMNGQTIQSMDIPASASSFTKQIDLHNYTAGNYIVRLKTDNKTITTQLVVY